MIPRSAIIPAVLLSLSFITTIYADTLSSIPCVLKCIDESESRRTEGYPCAGDSVLAVYCCNYAKGDRELIMGCVPGCGRTEEGAFEKACKFTGDSGDETASNSEVGTTKDGDDKESATGSGDGSGAGEMEVEKMILFGAGLVAVLVV